VLPTDVNVHGIRDVGVTPDLLPGYHPLTDHDYRTQLEEAWGVTLPAEAGLGFRQMVDAALEGRLKALLVVGDNPLLTAPDKAAVRQALERLDLLVVIDAVMSDTAELAHVVLPDADVYGKEGTYTAADRRVLRRNAATTPVGVARPALVTLADLGARLAAARGLPTTFAADPKAVMDEIAALVPLYAPNRYDLMLLHERQQLFDGAVPATPRRELVQLGDFTGQAGSAPEGAGLALITGRGLYTSWEAAALHKRDADKLHREEFVEVNVNDAAQLGVQDGDEVLLQTESGELRMRARVTDIVPAGAVFVPLLYDGGAITALLGPDNGPTPAPSVQVRALTRA
jgi:predicted molibdopterin-dependent oxidoreductase YjgC